MAVFVPTRAEVERLAVGAGRAVEAAHHRVLPRRRADPGDPALSRGRGRAAVPPGDDRGGAVRAQRARARHRRDLRRALRQRGGARAERAPPALSRRQRDPADGGPGARPGAQRRGRHPERPRPRLRAAPAHAARVPARRRRRARGDHLRRARRGRARSRPARCRSTAPPTDGRVELLTERGLVEDGPAHRLRPRGRGDAGRAPLGRAAGARRRRAGPDGRGLLQHRLAAPDDARGARPPRAWSSTAAITSPPTTSTPKR